MRRLVITTVDETILPQFTTYPYLTAEQVTDCYTANDQRTT